jgi:predicted TIM-barrel fold metal-dependent hydrolase
MTLKHMYAGRGEPILEPDIPIIDAHHHLFDRPALRYMLGDYLQDVACGHRIVASVYVETQAFARTDGPEAMRPLGEIEFANGVAAMAASGVYGECRVNAAIVGYADLRLGDAVAEYLDAALALAPARLKGIRQVAIDDPSVLKSPGFRLGFKHLGPRGLAFDAAVFHHQLGDVADLADAFPDTTIVLNHMGQAMGLDTDATGRKAVFNAWRDALRDLARRPNVMCKVGGLGLPFWGFGLEERDDPIGYLELANTWRPYVETAIELFTAQRCMMESDFPPDGRSCGFVPLWNALKHVVRAASCEDKAALFHGTAARVYGIDLNGLC